VERIIAAAVLATLAIGVAWELWELATDAAAGSDLSGGIADTALDLAADCLGALAGGTLAVGVVRASAAAG
jgi:hypothetical protein